MRQGNLIICFFFLLIVSFSCGQKGESVYQSGEDWPVYLGSKSSSQYSSLNQVNKENVTQLEVAWEYRTGDIEGKKNTQIQCNPIILDGVLYGSTPTLRAFAINAESGEKLWEFNPHEKLEIGASVNRGLTFWSEGEDKRVFYTAGPYLFALNPENGILINDFGEGGMVPLNTGLGDWAQNLYVISSSPGVIYKDKLIIGSRVSESANAAPGYVRAFNAKTGEVDWIFHTIPQPGEYGYNTWPINAYLKSGGANSWAGMSLDEERGMVFIPTGSASFDFWGGHRLGKNLFANSVLALNAENGERIWHYQTVRHDVWDRDLPAPPNLVTIEMDGQMVDAVAQITKTGRVFLFDRESGTPLFPIEEVEIPASDLMGEETWSTQPLPTSPPPFSRQVFTDDEITNISPESHQYVKEKIEGLKYGHIFQPPSTEGTIIFPGFDGGGEWGGAAFDPHSGYLYVNANEMAWILTMVPTEDKDEGPLSLGKSSYMTECGMCHGQDLKGDLSGAFPSMVGISERLEKEEIMKIVENGKGRMPGFKHLSKEKMKAVVDYILQPNVHQDTPEKGRDSNLQAVPYTTTGYNRFFDQDGYPAIKPPWGTLNAIDLGKGKIVWSVPLGEFEALTKKGIPKTGTENYGGPVVTAGGLVFIGGSKDEYFRAFDKDTGEELWKYKLPAAGYATPAVYAVNGKQYIVIAAGGGKIGTASGDSYMAFSLPE
ncbi:MAG: PQQ-binding-like beta-propeller repeat protein [Cyclobacteriaceae bacterium]